MGKFLSPQIDHDLYINRDPKKYFQNFLNQSIKIAFPILGAGGVGKTWQIQAYLNDLPEKYLPVVLSVRLLSDLETGVKNELLSLFQEVDRGKCKDLGQTLQEIQTCHPSLDKSILLFLDGLNEYHFEKSSFEKLKKEFFSLLSLLGLFNIRMIFSCRTFTWQEFLHDEAFKTFFFVSGSYVQQINIRQYDSVKNEVVESTMSKEVDIYGLMLDKFDTRERNDFWSNLSLKVQVSKKTKINYSQECNPFFLGILAKHLCLNKGSYPPPGYLFSEYINQQLSKASSKEAREAKQFLISFTELFISLPEKTVLPSITENDLSHLKHSSSLNLLLDLGLVKASETNSYKRFLYFSHDVLMHYFVSKVLSIMLDLDKNPIANQLTDILRISKQAIQDSRNDYFRESVRFLVNSLVEDSNFCGYNNYLPGRIFYLLCSSIRNNSPDISFFNTASADILSNEQFGTWLSIVLRDSLKKDVVNSLLSNICIKKEKPEYISNLVILASCAENSTAINFLKRVIEAKPPRLTKMRCAFSLGEMNSKKAIPLIIDLLDLDSSFFGAINNACMYSLEKFGHRLDDSTLRILKNQKGSAWRMEKYINKILKKENHV